MPGSFGLTTLASGTIALNTGTPDIMLLGYRPGRSYSAFTRTSVANQRSEAGDLEQVASGAIRDDHWFENPVTGLFERSTRIERLGTNLATQSENFGAWTLSTNCTRTAGQADPRGGTGGYLLADTSAATVAHAKLSLGTVQPTGMSVWLRQGTATATRVGIWSVTRSTWVQLVEIT